LLRRLVSDKLKKTYTQDQTLPVSAKLGDFPKALDKLERSSHAKTS
jgi:hypothetical protein